MSFVPLPRSVEQLLESIQSRHSQVPVDKGARQVLASLTEDSALSLLNQISPSTNIRNLSAFIMHLAKNQSDSNGGGVTCPAREQGNMPQMMSAHLEALSELEFRKGFLILSYLGRKRLEDEISPDYILSLKNLPMIQFEKEVWEGIGWKHIEPVDRRQDYDWDIQKAHIYRCLVDQDGTVAFKGPFLQKTRNHLQRVLGDENVLDVRFTEVVGNRNKSASSTSYDSLLDSGISVAWRRYRFFVYKDGGKEEKKKSPSSSPVKCYFVCNESNHAYHSIINKPIGETRSMFMHIHRVTTMSKYMSRFSLILSKTMKLDVDLATVNVEFIEDIPCLDRDGQVILDADGEPLIHTDGTGYISDDLAIRCPNNIYKGQGALENAHINNIPNNIYKGQCPGQGALEVKLENVPLEEKSLEIVQNHLFRQPPLLIQFRMFKNGYAVKGTVLVDKRLPPRTIHVRRSMVKVSRDEGLPISQSVNSFEIVGTSNHPKQAYLSKYIIAHLSYGGVPKEYFLNLVENALDQAQNLLFNKRTALQAALRHGDMDKHIVSRMILCGIPIDEPFLQERLSFYMKEERKRLMSGKVPLEDCYYLMGTADPSHKLWPNEVCIIHENGHISGKVLVYKHPGLHFGDVHILTATYVREIADIVGNSKYAIFFPTTGSRSLAEEIANSDFDGDMYWVTRNPQLLDQFKASEPWERPSTKRKMEQPMPSEFSEEVLERKLFECFLNSRFGAWNIIGAAADSWLVYMDRLLTLGDECAVEKSCLKEKMLKLVNIYYDALDADKHGIKVNFPYELKPEKFPHFMERGRNEYKSKSVLGLIYDMVKSFEPKDAISEEICPLPCFCVEVPQASLDIWTARYAQYRKEMSSALGIEDKDDKNKEADRVLQVYTKMLYEAEDFEGSMRKKEDIFNEALAIYKITYRYAKDSNEIRRCGFAWKVAGHALCKLYTVLRNEESFSCSPSVLRELWG